jgi:hypothetical protein
MVLSLPGLGTPTEDWPSRREPCALPIAAAAALAGDVTNGT